VIVGIVIAAILVPLVCAGIVASLLHDNLAEELGEWPSRKAWERRRRKRLPRDSHAQARVDGAYVDGMITGAVLDDLDDMFK
jgi:hypothetical protein